MAEPADFAQYIAGLENQIKSLGKRLSELEAGLPRLHFTSTTARASNPMATAIVPIDWGWTPKSVVVFPPGGDARINDPPGSITIYHRNKGDVDLLVVSIL